MKLNITIWGSRGVSRDAREVNGDLLEMEGILERVNALMEDELREKGASSVEVEVESGACVVISGSGRYILIGRRGLRLGITRSANIVADFLIHT